MIQAISKNSSSSRPQPTGWTRRLPDGAVSLSEVGDDWVLRASQPLQAKFEELLERQKLGTLTAEELEEYEALCALDDALSWLNRLARREQRR
jgi:hypothetical protein